MCRLFTVTILSFSLLSVYTAQAQNDAWTLQSCVQYAVDHNISIQQDVLNKRLAHFTLLQSQLAQLPTLNGNASYNSSFGRSVNPTTNQFVDADYNYVGFGANSNLLIFGWFQQRNLINKNKFSLQATQADLDQLKDDVSLNVATGYLRSLQALEQIHVSDKQVELSKAQLAQTRSFADAGRLPELNVAQLESQLATDSSNLINAIATYNSTILDLKTLLNLDFDEPFSIIEPDMPVDDQMAVSSMLPEEIYLKAKAHFGSIKSAEFKLTAAQKGMRSAEGALYPQLTLNYQAGSNWASNFFSYVPGNSLGYQPIGITQHGRDTVLQPVYQVNQVAIPLGTQLNNNFRQVISLSLNFSLFNGWQSQYTLRQAKINVQTQELSLYQSELTLKQNVYKAHNDAVNSIQKYYAALRAAEAAQRALDFAKKRYDLGLTSTVDFLVTQNSNYAAAYNLLSSKYDLIFKLKVIDYYLGKELKL